MKCRFYVGPAGSGKTHRCVEDVAACLRQAPDGLPLLYLAPKQATYQVERQLLQRAGVEGWTRLLILSFDRLARFILEKTQGSIPPLVTEEARVMALRAILHQARPQLQAFEPTRRSASLARHLSQLIREFQQSGIGPKQLREVCSQIPEDRFLRSKLADIALVWEGYREWLRGESLEDGDRLPDLAAEALADQMARRRGSILFEGIWMDGFAEMTPQEFSLLDSLLPHCSQATMAFCLGAGDEDAGDDLSMWTVTARAFQRCRAMVSSKRLQWEVEVLTLPRDQEPTRFSGNPAFDHLERHWGTGKPYQGEAREGPELIGCVDQEGEAVVAAREILSHVQRGGNYREASVIVRDLESAKPMIERVFRRYGIPFHMDQRQPVARHALAELTRHALRVAAWGWRQEELFAMMKTGLITSDESAVDQLENWTLARGWNGESWLRPIAEGDESRATLAPLEALRSGVIGPLQSFRERLDRHPRPDGESLAGALRTLWAAFPVEATLRQWGENADPEHPEFAVLHRTIWRTLGEWLQGLELVFKRKGLPLSEWIEVVDAGLESLTAGVVPPTLDQVSVGAVDRSRLVDVRLAIVAGFNDDTFPMPPAAPGLLGDGDREALSEWRMPLGLTRRQRAAREQFLAYIALTRATERLVVSWSRLDEKGKPRNPSPFARELARLFPHLRPALDPQSSLAFGGVKNFADVRHKAELAELEELRLGPQLDPGDAGELLSPVPQAAELLRWRREYQATLLRESIDPSWLARRHPAGLVSSVSALEDFAACPFRYFASRTLRLKERDEFKTDPRTLGELAHEILRAFHEAVKARGQSWRDLGSEEAEALAATLGREASRTFKSGLYAAGPDTAFEGEILVARVARLVGAMAGWMRRQYLLNPSRVELPFGEGADGLPALRISLAQGGEVHLRGRIDRVDWLLRNVDGSEEKELLVAVFDYKSRAQRIAPKHLHNGLQLQLLAYLAVLAAADPALLGAGMAGADIKPVGAFYIPILGVAPSKKSRAELLHQSVEERRKAYIHRGLFDESHAGLLDALGTGKSNDQFAFHHNSKNQLQHTEFERQIKHVVEMIASFSSRILAGEAVVAPYRDGSMETACDDCDFNSVCRFDKMLRPYRALKTPPRLAKPSQAKQPGSKVKASRK